MTDTCSWGILSTAKIAQKNWRAICNAENASLAAVASRELSRVEAFTKRLQDVAPLHPQAKLYGSYDKLLADPFVDAVYLPLPTTVRKQWAIRSAAAGKHVLLEKPCGCSTEDVAEIIAACDANDVQFMDGTMLMHSERLQRMRDVIGRGQLGSLKRIATHVSFNGDSDFLANNIRADSHLEPLGALGDIGWYCIRIILWAMDFQQPMRVSGRMITSTDPKDDSQPVPLEFSGEMFFDGGVSAGFYCSFLTELQQWVHISGTEGAMFVDDFMLPEHEDSIDFDVYHPEFKIEGTRFEMDLHKRNYSVKETGSGAKNSQETKMFRRFSELVLSNRRELQWAEYALKTQRVLDACLASAHREGALVPVE